MQQSFLVILQKILFSVFIVFFNFNNSSLLSMFGHEFFVGQQPVTSVAFNVNDNLCLNCRQHPKYMGHNYCSVDCRSAHLLCLNCKQLPKYEGQNYCSAACLNAHLCLNCRQHPKYMGYNYCSIACRSAHLCLNCKRLPKYEGQNYCSAACLNTHLCLSCKQYPKYLGCDYCSKRCQDNFLQVRQEPLMISTGPQVASTLPEQLQIGQGVPLATVEVCVPQALDQNICPQCKESHSNYDSSTGKPFLFCGRECVAAYKRMVRDFLRTQEEVMPQVSTEESVTEGLALVPAAADYVVNCAHCGVRARNQGFDYCSRACGQAAMGPRTVYPVPMAAPLYVVRLTDEAQKAVDVFPDNAAVLKKIKLELGFSPKRPNCTILAGYGGQYRRLISENHRVVYRIEADDVVVTVIYVARRNDKTYKIPCRQHILNDMRSRGEIN